MGTVTRSPLQFAAVREDPRIERTLVLEHAPRRVLLVASGGCTALALRAWFPALAIELVDPNPAQLAHVERKLAALAASAEPAAFNVGTPDPDGLAECGNFERLFRAFRALLDLFVVAGDERRLRLETGAAWDDVVAHPYWPVAFALAFADPLLVAMFGPDAVQHAVPGSYPAYFQRRIELGLAAPDRATNPWLHHVLLGHYLTSPAAWPPYLREPPRDHTPFRARRATLLELESFAPYDLVQLSNVPDWMADPACDELARRMAQEMRPGSVVLFRALNDPRDLVARWSPSFTFDPARDARLADLERSLFYDEVHAGVHR